MIKFWTEWIQTATFLHFAGVAVEILTLGWVWSKILFLPLVTCCGSMDMANILRN
jgi:hypothetical protein